MMYGSYENADLLEKLAACGLNLNLKDKAGKTPLDYAREQSSGKMASFLSDALRIPRHSMVESMELSHVPEDDWEPATHDFNEDAANLLE